MNSAATNNGLEYRTGVLNETRNLFSTHAQTSWPIIETNIYLRLVVLNQTNTS